MKDDKQAEHLGREPARYRDLTQGPILRTLLVFSIPTLFSNVLQTLGTTVNMIWVGQLIGDTALAATANANMVMFLVFALVFGFGMAATVKVGQHFGSHDYDAARRVFGAGTGFCAIIAVTGGGIGWFPRRSSAACACRRRRRSTTWRSHISQVVFLTMPIGTVSMMVSMSLRGGGRRQDAALCHDPDYAAGDRAQSGADPRARPGAAAGHRRLRAGQTRSARWAACWR